MSILMELDTKEKDKKRKAVNSLKDKKIRKKTNTKKKDNRIQALQEDGVIHKKLNIW